jgi:DNA-3-methyladenine glycosylase II
MDRKSKEVHQRFINISNELNPDLVVAIRQIGPIEFRPDDSLPLAHRLCRSVAGQQLSVIAARTIWQRVLIAADGKDLTEFFNEENTEIMRRCGLSNAKVRAMCGIAEEGRAGKLETDDLRKLSHNERSRELTRLWGVGQWTVDMISIFYFGDEDVWPDGDLAVRKTLEHLTSRRRKTVRTAERFAPHRSWLALYMWEYKNAVPDLS